MAFGITPGPDESRLTYGSYLKVNELLGLQQLLSEPAQHDELLFIVIHQVYELWFKQLIHEMDAVLRCLDSDDVLGAHRLIRRGIEIQRVLIEQVNVLETMTPNDFLTFRDELMPASGFQSAQFRALEYMCGLKDERHLSQHPENSRARAMLRERMEGPTLGDRFHALVERREVDDREGDDDLPAEVVARVRRLVRIYQHPQRHYDLYLLSEALIEFDEAFYLWRLRHVAMVERMIGSKPGTGGSEGVGYLKSTLGRKFFPELWEVRTWLSARSRPTGRDPG